MLAHCFASLEGCCRWSNARRLRALRLINCGYMIARLSIIDGAINRLGSLLRALPMPLSAQEQALLQHLSLCGATKTDVLARLTVHSINLDER